MDRRTILIVFLLLAGFALGPTKNARGDQPSGISGKWTGTSKVSCGSRMSKKERCNALQNITFVLKQDGSNLTGTYSCAFGTQDCLGLNEQGSVIGSYDGTNFLANINMGNGSTCSFKGAVSATEGQGSYRCKGSTAAEQGTWRISRVGGKPVPKAEQVAPALRPYLP
jgi:hypothetical protein